jgi:O-succinylbenzoate synthase
VAKLARLDLYRLAVPLTTPYRLSFTELKHFDTVMARAADDDGRSGWGEATLLTGYTEESIEQSFKLAGETANAILGMPLEEAKARFGKLDKRAPFTATAFYTSMEMLQDEDHRDRQCTQRRLRNLQGQSRFRRRQGSRACSYDSKHRRRPCADPHRRQPGAQRR